MTTIDTVPQLGGGRCNTFNLHGMDLAWDEKLRQILRACGVNVLHNSHLTNSSQATLLGSVVPGGDTNFALILKHNLEHVARLDGNTRRNILAYFGSRPGLSNDVVNVLKSLPLFLRSETSATSNVLALPEGARGGSLPAVTESPLSRYITLDMATNYMVLYDEESYKSEGHALKLMQLQLEATCFLAFPLPEFQQLYRTLGVRIDTSQTFICERLNVKLPTIIRASLAEDGTDALPVLAELKSWVCSKNEGISAPVIKVFRAVKFVPNIAGRLVAPEELLDPKSKVVTEFEDSLCERIPAPDFVRANRDLLIKLKMSEYLRPVELLRCAQHLQSLRPEDGYAVSASGLKWEALVRRPSDGVELTDEALAKVLMSKTGNMRTLSQEEWDGCGIQDLHVTSFINICMLAGIEGEAYFRPRPTLDLRMKSFYLVEAIAGHLNYVFYGGKSKTIRDKTSIRDKTPSPEVIQAASCTILLAHVPPKGVELTERVHALNDVQRNSKSHRLPKEEWRLVPFQQCVLEGQTRDTVYSNSAANLCWATYPLAGHLSLAHTLFKKEAEKAPTLSKKEAERALMQKSQLFQAKESFRKQLREHFGLIIDKSDVSFDILVKQLRMLAGEASMPPLNADLDYKGALKAESKSCMVFARLHRLPLLICPATRWRRCP